MIAKTTASKKAKGSRLERKIASEYRSTGLFPKAQRQLLSGGGYLKGDINKGETDPDMFVEECKNQEKVKLWEWWVQARSQCSGFEKPLLHISGNNRPILSVIGFDELVQLRLELKQLREELYGRNSERR